MRRLGTAGVLALVLALPARGEVALLTQPILDTLTTIDALPSTEQLDTAHGGSRAAALANLTLIAVGEGAAVDPGVQVRAVRVLAPYCGLPPCDPDSPAHVTLVTIATTPRYRDARAGSDLVILRAALGALGQQRVAAAAPLVIPLLEHPNRDIRAAAALALRDLGSLLAVAPLRARYQQEQVPQVRLAISAALRALGQPPP